MSCTCGPHPCVNLTTAYLQYHKKHPDNDDTTISSKDEELTSCHEQIRQACRSHGCFHVSIDLTNNNEDDDEIDSPMKCMAKPIEEVENEIESLFSPTVLDTIDADLNGGLVKVPINNILPSNTNVGSSQCMQEVATFRGRTAESGDELQSKPEPKLSWEYCRCRSARIEECKNDDDDDMSTSMDSSHDIENDTPWNHLSNWTKALHSVAAVVINSIGISLQVVLNEKDCDCLHKSITSRQNSNNTNILQEKCNVDLLRCFRYDAISADDENAQQLGSSSHTDWGSLTVVWQDCKGGLQTYCHTCEKWSDVAAAPERNGSGSKTIHLFVHVGDFLSLATHGEGMTHLPIWPSPRHRVICPTKKKQPPDDQSSSSDEEKSLCRRSLVYFAYPPPNISLAAAQKVVEPLLINDDDSSESTAVFQDYSLLHNQSQQQQATADQLVLNEGRSSTNFETYEKMRTKPFGEVIQEKWDQVQRN